MKSFTATCRNKIAKLPLAIKLPATAITIAAAYVYGWTILTDQSTTYTVWDSDFTVNILILFGLFGALVDKKVKHLPKWKAWTIWAGATLALILFFKYVGGLETWW